MKQQTSQSGDTFTVKLSGELTFDDHGPFRGLLDEISASGMKTCNFDFTELTAIDSAGLGLLMVAFEKSEKQHWKLVILHARGQVKRMLEITEFGKLMTVID